MTFLLRRLLWTLPVVFGVVTFTFLLIHFIPGDPVDVMLGEQASIEDKNALRQSLGLDQPLSVQYGKYLSHLVRFNLGHSLYSQRPVTAVILERLPATVELTLGAMFLALLLGVPFGVWAATQKYSLLDHFLSVISLLSVSLPGFFTGPILIWFFSIQLDLFPVGERGGLEHLFLPALSLALPLSSILFRMTRASLLEVIKEDYIRVARAKGLKPVTVYMKHALANALMPVITIVGLQFGALLTGAVIAETIFDWPGLGTLLFLSIQQRDYTLVQGCILVVSLTYVFVNLMTDIAYAIVNPRVRLEGIS